jgi:hypothetical protein
VRAAGVTLLVDCGITQGHDPLLPFARVAALSATWPTAWMIRKTTFFLELSGAGTSWKAARRHRLTGYSAHADQDTLAAWVAAMPEPPGEI